MLSSLDKFKQHVKDNFTPKEPVLVDYKRLQREKEAREFAQSLADSGRYRIKYKMI